MFIKDNEKNHSCIKRHDSEDLRFSQYSAKTIVYVLGLNAPFPVWTLQKKNTHHWTVGY